MATPSHAAAQLRQGSLSFPVAPPGLPDVGSAAIAVISQLPAADSGALVSYLAGVFTRQFWTTGPAVPLLIEILPAEAVRQVRDQVARQLCGPGSGLDDLPLRIFVEAASLYLERDASGRFTSAAFGPITEVASGELQGEVAWPGGVAGTVVGSAGRIAAQTHLAPVAAGEPVPLREADLRSLVLALDNAVATQTVDPQWQTMLGLAKEALPTV